MKRQQSILVISLLAAFALAGAACSKTETNSNNANTSTNTSKTTTTNTTTTNTTTANSSTPTTTATGNSTPTDTFRALYDAFKNKDVAALKKTMASADLKALEERSKKNGESADDFLKMLVESPETTPPSTLEMRNEKINGDKATLEVKDKTGQWDKISFVKEGNEWKVLMFGEEEDPGKM